MTGKVAIGIEIHCELCTKTKMFSSAPVSFKEKPNHCVNEIDAAFPGTLPGVNRRAVEFALKVCMALGCEIDPLVRFDRKNYNYPDLPKGYQITQHFHPLGKNGSIVIETEKGKKTVRIRRVHMEEDTAKMIHDGNKTYIDFNRAGIPLVEIVSEPDMQTGDEAAAYVSELRNTLKYLGVSDAKMEEGSLRCDINVSVQAENSDTAAKKSEIKNLNSIANIRKAADAEIRRQCELIESGEIPESLTVRYDEKTGKTVYMRSKEDADYRYFPEPNIPAIRLSADYIESVRDALPETPEKRFSKFTRVYGLPSYEARILTDEKEKGDFLEETMRYTDDAAEIAKYLITDIPGYLRANRESFEDREMRPEDLAELVRAVKEKAITSVQAKELLPGIINGESPTEKIRREKNARVGDEDAIRGLVKTVLEKNAQAAADYREGKKKAFGFLVGSVMKESGGKADPALINRILKEEFDK